MSCHLPCPGSKKPTRLLLVSCVFLDLPGVTTFYGTSKINQMNVWGEILFSEKYLSKINEKHFFTLFIFLLIFIFIRALGPPRTEGLFLKRAHPLRGTARRQLLEGRSGRSRWWPQDPLMGQPWWMTCISAHAPPPEWGRGRHRQGADGFWITPSPFPRKPLCSLSQLDSFSLGWQTCQDVDLSKVF